MKLITLLKLLMPEQMVKIYTPYMGDVPDFEGEAGNVPWCLAEMEIDESVGIYTEDVFMEISLKEEKVRPFPQAITVPLGDACSVSTADYQHKPYSFIVWKHEDSSTYK